MDFKIKIKNGGIVYRVPEDMLLRPALAMIEGGTAERIEARVETSAINRMRTTAAKIYRGPLPFFRVVGGKVFNEREGTRGQF